MTPPTSGSLFDDDPADGSLVRVLARSKPAGKAQQRFHRLVEKIELRREQLRQWQTYSLRYNQRLAGEMEPVRTQYRAAQQKMVLLIDELLTGPAPGRRLGRVQRTKLRDLLFTLADNLLEDGRDAALEAVLAKYRAPAGPQDQELESELLRAVLNDTLGMDIGADHGASSPEELLRHAQRKMRERAEAEDRRAQERQRGAGGSRARGPHAEAAQAKRQQAAREVSQSLREVFRKLVSALHPDREPDAEARHRKTLLMQQVNQAYEADDLLTLLSLQLEIEQIDAAHLSSLSAQRLAHYNQILGEQLAELESELQRFVEPFQRSLGGSWRPSLTTTDIDRQLSADIAQLRAALRELQQDLVGFRDPDRLRESLKRYQLQETFQDPDELADLIGLTEILRPPRRRRKSRRR